MIVIRLGRGAPQWRSTASAQFMCSLRRDDSGIFSSGRSSGAACRRRLDDGSSPPRYDHSTFAANAIASSHVRGLKRGLGAGWSRMGAAAREWAYLVEPYARPANERLFERLK